MPSLLARMKRAIGRLAPKKRKRNRSVAAAKSPVAGKLRRGTGHARARGNRKLARALVAKGVPDATAKTIVHEYGHEVRAVGRGTMKQSDLVHDILRNDRRVPVGVYRKAMRRPSPKKRRGKSGRKN